MRYKRAVVIVGFFLLISSSAFSITDGSTIKKENNNQILSPGITDADDIVPSILHQGSQMDAIMRSTSKVDLLNSGKAFEGYTLFTPWFSIKTYLINNSWKIVHTWQSLYQPALPVDLLTNGNLLRGCYIRKPGIVWGSGDTGRVEMFDWNGTLLWYFEYVSDQHCLHHDIEPLPNGNILMIAWEVKNRTEAVAMGCNPDLVPEDVVWPDHIIEVKPNGSSGGDIVWEWHVWDHMIQDYNASKPNFGVVSDHPELIDINFMARDKDSDWTHINSIDYNEKLDQILVSSPVQNEVWIIDHHLTTEEAAGHTAGRYGRGGDLLYRWGNPQVYDAGDSSDQKLFSQHDAEWIEPGCPGAGHITIFNNGFQRPEGDYSSVEEIAPPVDDNGAYALEPGEAYGPEEPVWTYTAKNPSAFYSAGQGSAQRLPNGDTLVCNAQHGVLFEVTSEKKVDWLYFNLLVKLFPGGFNLIFQAHRYPLNYSGVRKASFIANNDSSNQGMDLVRLPFLYQRKTTKSMLPMK